MAVRLKSSDADCWRPTSERELGAVAEALVGGRRDSGGVVARLRDEIAAGGDPLGEAFCRLRSAAERRRRGATYTPAALVRAMLDRAAELGEPARVVEPGSGSGRFLIEAARRFPRARLVAVELDPLAARLARANLAVLGLSARAEVICGDYCRVRLPAVEGPTLFVGNPPYVRHHELSVRTKSWLAATAARHGLHASRLAGLHVHFLLATFERARAGDFGVLVTAAEWLDTNYGRLARGMLAGRLGLARLELLCAGAKPFADAMTTAAIASFRVDDTSATVELARAESVAALDRARRRCVAREALAKSSRWSEFLVERKRSRRDSIELGELCRVHRGQATGANRVWVVEHGFDELPARFLRPTVTRARELIAAGERLTSTADLRRVIDLPVELDVLSSDERAAVLRFLRRARLAGAADGYIARHRRAWWAVELREPAPILATYMARRAPAFVVNAAGARHINIAHGLYPREPLSAARVLALVRHLRATVEVSAGRTYAGGLVKFEPREMERLLVPWGGIADC